MSRTLSMIAFAGLFQDMALAQYGAPVLSAFPTGSAVNTAYTASSIDAGNATSALVVGTAGSSGLALPSLSLTQHKAVAAPTPPYGNGTSMLIYQPTASMGTGTGGYFIPIASSAPDTAALVAATSVVSVLSTVVVSESAYDISTDAPASVSSVSYAGVSISSSYIDEVVSSIAVSSPLSTSLPVITISSVELEETTTSVVADTKPSSAASSVSAPYGFPNASTIATAGGASSGTNYLTVTAPASTSSASNVSAVISSALSQITANVTTSLASNVTAGLSSAIAQITSLANAGAGVNISATSTTSLSGPETFNSSNTLPPNSILAGISSAVAQITSLMGASSAETTDFASATPPSASETASSSVLTADAVVAATTTAASTGLAGAAKFAAWPSTLLTQTLSPSVTQERVADVAAATETATPQSEAWLADTLAWAAKVVKHAFNNKNK